MCPHFATRETPREAAASLRRSAADSSKKAGKVKEGPVKGLGQTKSSHQKEFNLVTPKMHALVHYPDMFERFGTTDSYSTQLVCVYHILLTLLMFICPGRTRTCSCQKILCTYQQENIWTANHSASTSTSLTSPHGRKRSRPTWTCCNQVSRWWQAPTYRSR